MQAKRYLEQIRKIDFMITDKTKDYYRWIAVAEGLGGFSVGDKVQTSKNLQQIPDAIGRYIDIDREIAALRDKRAAIIKTLEQLPLFEYRLLYKLYVEDCTAKEAAYDLGKSHDCIRHRKMYALRMVQKIIDREGADASRGSD